MPSFLSITMFYSETLLAKNGPLARVWLASNLERKLSKQNVLSEKLETKVNDIIGTGQAPMALRMSGQLLLGVVRIYSKKAKYLLDDCSEALSKIRLVSSASWRAIVRWTDLSIGLSSGQQRRPTH